MIVSTEQPRPAPYKQLAMGIAALVLFGILALIWFSYSHTQPARPESGNPAVIPDGGSSKDTAEVLMEIRTDDEIWDEQMQARRDFHNEYINRLIDSRDKARARNDNEAYERMVVAIVNQLEHRDSELSSMRKTRRGAQIAKQPVSQEYLDKLAAGQKAHEERSQK